MRRVAAVCCVVLALLLLVPATVVATVRPALVDTDRFVSTLAPLATEPTVQEAVANRVVMAADPLVDRFAAELLATADPRIDALAQRVGDGASAEQLAAAVARDLIARAATAVTASDAFASLWRGALTLTHRELIAPLATGGSGTLTRFGSSGSLGIDLAPVVEAVAQRALDMSGLTDTALLDRLPDEVVVPVLDSDELGTLVTWTPVLAGAGIWLPILTGVLAVGSVLLARRRAITGAVLGLGAAALAGLSLLALALVRGALIDRATGVIEPVNAVGLVSDALTGGLRTMWLVLAVAGVLVAVTALVIDRRTTHSSDQDYR